MSDEIKNGESDEALNPVAANGEMMGQTEEEEVAISFPIYHMTKGVKLPEKGIYFVIGSNGMFVHKPNMVGRSLVPVDGISFLEPVQTFIMPKMPKLPARIINQAYTFFHLVYRQHQSESGLVLFYNDEKKDFLLWCPRQEVSHGSCHYDRNDYGGNEESLAGYNIVGSIHSHADFGAFHSGTDVHDEENFDGLHITIGNVDKPVFSICASVAISKQREQVEPEQCALGLERQVSEGEGRWLSFQRSGYTLNLSPEELKLADEDEENIRKFWLPKVTKKVWSWSNPAWGGGKKKGGDEDGDDGTFPGNWVGLNF